MSILPMALALPSIPTMTTPNISMVMHMSRSVETMDELSSVDNGVKINISAVITPVRKKLSARLERTFEYSVL